MIRVKYGVDGARVNIQLAGTERIIAYDGAVLSFVVDHTEAGFVANFGVPNGVFVEDGDQFQTLPIVEGNTFTIPVSVQRYGLPQVVIIGPNYIVSHALVIVNG